MPLQDTSKMHCIQLKQSPKPDRAGEAGQPGVHLHGLRHPLLHLQLSTVRLKCSWNLHTSVEIHFVILGVLISTNILPSQALHQHLRAGQAGADQGV